MNKEIAMLQKKIVELESEIRLQKNEARKVQGIYDCELGKPATSKDEFYLTGYGEAYASGDAKTIEAF